MSQRPRSTRGPAPGVAARLLGSARVRRAALRLPRRVLAPLRWLWSRFGVPQWEYVGTAWGEVPAVKGWNVPAVAEAYEARLAEFTSLIARPNGLGVVHEGVLGAPLSSDDLGAHNAAVSLGYVFARTAIRREAISVLDWGGALGHHYLLARELLPATRLDYTCKELPDVCARGSRLVPAVRFVSDASYTERTYDLVLASDSLQYEPDCSAALAEWARLADGFVFVTRLPVTLTGPSFVTLQRAYAYGYETEYRGWVLNRDKVLAAATEARLALEREFVIADAPYIRRAPAPVEIRGYLFRPHAEAAA